MPDKRFKSGLAIAIADNILFGLFPVAASYFVKTIDPLVFSALATFIGSFPFLIHYGFKHKLVGVFEKTHTINYALVAFLTASGTLFYFQGAKLTSSVNTALLTQVEPLYGILLGALFLHEVVGWQPIVATIFMVVGAAALVFKGFSGVNIGDIFILVNGVFFQLSHFVSKRLLSHLKDSNVVPSVRLFYGGLFLVIIAAIFRADEIIALTFKQWISIILFGLLLRSLDLTLWYQALKRIPLSVATATIPISVAVSFLGSIFLLRETITFWQYIGLGSIVAGILWLSYFEFNRFKRPVH